MLDTGDGIPPGVAPYPVPKIDYFNLAARYEFGPGTLDGLALQAGVENVGDEDPPVIPTSSGANTDPSQYDVLGRRYYVKLNYRF
ncbi:MAG: TonB-dependent receptor [Steroidobacteraceae bacterium]|nr:TonB-dependent receptor [Steroidobacteraceae bacterium]